MKSAESGALASKPSKHISKTRWWIVWTLFFSTVTNYISRQSFSVLSPMITAQYHLSHTDLAKILGSFQISYAITWLIGGIVLDAVGSRVGLAAAALWWSVMNILTGFASSVFGFAFFRFMLGIGEGFNWPGASKVVAEWFPREERSLAVAIFDSGSSVGGALAALTIPLIALAFGWRWGFAISGLLGFVWLAVWLRVYHPLKSHPRVSPEEVALIEAGRDAEPVTTDRGWVTLATARGESQSLGHCSGSSADRSNLVVLCFLVAAVSQRCARLHVETDCHVCVDSVYRGRHRQLYRRLDFWLLHSPWNAGGAGSHLDLSRQLCADSRRHSSRKCAQCVFRAGTDLYCVCGDMPAGPPWD